MLEDVGAIARRAGEVATRRPGPLFARALVFAAGSCAVLCLGFGIPIAGLALFGMYAIAARAPHHRGDGGKVVAMLASGVSLPFAAGVVGLTESTLAPVTGPIYGSLLASALAGVVLAPLHLASITLLVESRTLEAAFGRVVIATTGRGRTVALLGALEGVTIFAAASLLRSFLRSRMPDTVVWASSISTIVAVGHSWLWVATYDVVVKPHTGDIYAPRLGRIALVIAPPTIVLAASLLVATLSPSPAWIQREPRPIDEPGSGIARVEAGTPSGLRVTAVPGALEVSVDDGGGCGRIAFPGLANPFPPIRTTFRGRPAYEIGRRGARHVAYVDADGVRLDDTIGDRVGLRFDRAALALLSIAGALIVALVVVIRAASSTAAWLAARPIADVSDDATVALTGHLRVGDETSGRLRFETSDGVIVVPIDEGTLLGHEEGSRPADGAPAFVVAKARELRTRTHRSASAGRATIVGLGTIDDARRAFLERESRRLVWLGVPAALAILAAAGTILSAP